MKLSRTSIGFASLSLLAIAGCPVTGDALCEKGVCDALAVDATAPDGGQDAGDDVIVVLPRDPCVDKPLAAECLTNEGALFVSATANPAGADGSLEHPFPTITGAVNKVTNTKRRIYVCEGTYPEQVTLETLPKTLIGGVTCDFRGKGAKPKIAPPTGIALSIAAVGGASVLDVIVEGASIVDQKGASSVAMFITRSENILLRGVEAKALDAQPGVDGATAVNWDALLPFASNASGQKGGGPPSCGKCKDMTSSFAGGGGDSPGTEGGDAPEAGAAQPPAGGNPQNAGFNGATSCFAGDAGAPGTAGDASTGAARPGVLEPSAWNTEATSKAGVNGTPGQGGGGGGSTNVEGGGSGGCGGCGGAGGGAGGNGGSSIALLVYNSQVTIEKSSLTASAAGRGGNGGGGQAGQGGRPGGNGGCPGGPGGSGAGGNGGGGGAGGHSAAIAHVGAAPTLVESMLVSGAGGEAGKGGEAGAAAGGALNAGKAGEPGKVGSSGEIVDIN